MSRLLVSIVPILLVPVLAPRAVADEKDDQIARQLAAVVRDPRLPLPARVEAARMLIRLGPRATAAVPDLIAQAGRLRGAELEPLQEAVVEALGQIGGPARDALPVLARAAGRTVDIDQAVRRAAVAIIDSPGSRDVAALILQLTSRDESLRLRAAKALGGLGPDARAAVPALTAALADPDGDVRRAAAAALRRVQPDAKSSEELVRSIAADLKDPDDGVRLLAARSLGRLGSAAAGAVPALEAALADPDRDVRRAAADALARINSP